MDRNIVYPGSIPLDTDLLNVQRNIMIAEGFLAQAMLGNGPVANGLACTPTSPASMAVNIGPGMIAAQTTVDATAFGSLALDSTDALQKVGINLTSTSSTALGTITAPATSGYSQVYLISACFAESDTTPVVLPYYNAANPSVAYSGPANSGAAQNTQRIQRVGLALTAGTAAATGSQTTPAAPGGYVPLWAITVGYGATSITSGMIAAASGAPFVGGGSLLPGRLINVQKWTSGTNAYTPTVGTNSVIWEVVGGGASGGGAAACATAYMAAGSGGGSGAMVRHRSTSGFAGAAVVVGAGGAAPSAGANNGNAGGTSSVTGTGFTLTAPGGYAGVGGPTVNNSFLGGPGGGAPVGTGGNIVNAAGDQGGNSTGIIAGGNYYLSSGDGGASIYGEGATSVGGTTAGVAGTSPGAGGSGAASGGSGAGGGAEAGGAGAAGYVIAWEYS